MRNLWTFLLGAALAAPLAAGIVYEIEVTDHGASGSATETVELAVEGKNLKMDVASGRGREKGHMIFRGDRREMVVVDDDSQSYTVIDEAAFEAIGGMASQMNAAVEQALKNVPPDQRAAVEKMMKERMGSAGAAAGAAATRPRSELRATGERAEHAGYPCVRYDILRGGSKDQELWVTDWSNVEGGREVVEAFEGMADFFQEMMAKIADAAGGALPGGMEGNWFEHLKELDGFPIVTRDFEDGRLEEESTLRSASRRTLDPDEFEPPAGYKRRQMFPQ